MITNDNISMITNDIDIIIIIIIMLLMLLMILLYLLFRNILYTMIPTRTWTGDYGQFSN